MEREQQIKEMAKEICPMGCDCPQCCFNGHCQSMEDAQKLYDAGYRKQNEFVLASERGYNIGLVDGAKQFAEYLKEFCQGCIDAGYDGVGILDIEVTLKEFLENG